MKVEWLNTASKSPQVLILKEEISWLATDLTITWQMLYTQVNNRKFVIGNTSYWKLTSV